MGALHDRMLLDMKLKQMAATTQAHYLRACRALAVFHMKGPDQLGEAEVKEFLEHLLEAGAAPETLRMHVAGLRFLYGVTLNRPEFAERLPWPKVPRRMPDILSGSEVEKLLQAVRGVVPAMALTTAYAAGLRVAEICRLRVEDIDSKRQLIHVRLGKGKKDRYVMLSPTLLTMLREYWRQVRPRDGWLFPGRGRNTHIVSKTVSKALTTAVKLLKLKKRVTPHMLRHAFATHLLETGVDIRVIQALLGHASIRTTARYAQVSRRHIGRVQSPLDLLGTKEGAVLG